MPEIFGAALLGSAFQGGMNYLFGAQSNEWAKEREEIARRENYLYNEQAAQNADIRTRQLYGDLYSPQAQVNQLKEAGLSPSLFYGNAGGMSGQTGAQGSGAAGISPTAFGIQPMDAAIIAKTIAETDKIKAETKNVEKTTEKTSAEIENIIADTQNKHLQSVYNEYQNALAQCDLTVEASLVESKIENYIKQTEYLAYSTKSAQIKSEIDKASKESVINYLEEQTRNLAADTLLKQTQKLLVNEQISLTKQQCKDLISQIYTREGQSELNEKELKAMIKQWGIKNGFEKKLNDATINKMTSDIQQGWTSKFIDLLNVIKR